MQRPDLRNIAIIAHVDHGKTSLVDCLLKESGQFRESQLTQDCILDSNDLERERGITILAKNIALTWNDVRINIIDTPGHADFGGEVERVLQMADAALIMIDAFEGPKPQTRFVVKKALECNLKLIVVVNKIDRPDGRPDEALSEAFDLLVELGADDETLDFPYIFTSARDGYASDDPTAREGNFSSLLDMIVKEVPPPDVHPDEPLQMMVTSLEWSEYVGRIATGRINAGSVKRGDQVLLMKEDGENVKCKIEKLYLFDKLGKMEAETAQAGDIVALVGLDTPEIGDTVAHVENPKSLERIKVDEPTLSMVFTISNSPLVGQSGKYLTSRHLRARLMRELESNVALRVTEREEKESFNVAGRGILHLSILMEQMRREGFEFCVGKPEVIRKQVDGQWQEPFELLHVDVPSNEVGPVMEIVGARRGQIKEMTAGEGNLTHLQFLIPARGLIGLRTRLLNATRGEAVIHHQFDSYQPMEGEVPRRANGVLVSQERGKAVGYALWKLQDRADMFVKPGDDLYVGMIVGENARDNDMTVNPIREKKLTNVRSSGADDNIMLKPPRDMSLEACLEYIESDEYVEITPAAIRLRKIYLTEQERKRQHRGG